MSSGMRCAETTLASNGMPNSVRMSAAWRMTSQSLLDPITTPTFTWLAPFVSDTVGSSNVKARILGAAHLNPTRPTRPAAHHDRHHHRKLRIRPDCHLDAGAGPARHLGRMVRAVQDRKSTRLNSTHTQN